MNFDRKPFYINPFIAISNGDLLITYFSLRFFRVELFDSKQNLKQNKV